MKKFWYTVSAASNDPTTMNDVFCFCCLSASSFLSRLAMLLSAQTNNTSNHHRRGDRWGTSPTGDYLLVRNHIAKEKPRKT